ncbi:hypothetical protein [Streptomyces sp. NRRL WC-3549]|uniref:hypothetical protein n=1 Tax=Streptomyces sp. NRRL WC-3549 TaxID=1463925 RepID=UPI0004C61619|nr:hypothetical protein [Streptomyces sp. NRRL WC-3549]
MTNAHVRTVRRAGGAAALVVAFALSLTACGSDGGGAPKGEASVSSAPAKTDDANGGGGTVPDTDNVLVTIKNDQGIDMVVNSVVRDEGGFVTVSGQFKNNGSKFWTTPVSWSGEEAEVSRTGRSLAGMTLVDSLAKKRYYVLRDTDNRPLTTTGFAPRIDAGESLTFFAQFPAPAESSKQVDIQFPGFNTAKVEIP